MTSFPLQIVTPGGQAYDGMAQKLFCRTIVGDVAILARHCDYLTAVGMGEARVTTEDGTVRRAACIGGMLSVAGGRVRLMANTFEWAEDIDAAFLCGPQPMVEEVRDALAACGTPPANIHVELFGTTTPARPAARKVATDTPTDAATIAILQDGKRKEFTLPYDGDSILDAA